MTIPGSHRIAAVAGGLAGCLLAASGRAPWAALTILFGVAVGVVPTDLRERRIPSQFVVVGTVAAMLAAALNAIRDESWSPFVHAAGGAALVGSAFLVVHLVQPQGLGFGDVRLAALTGALAAYGTASIPTAAVAAAFAALIAFFVTVALRSKSAPFAPYLLVAAVIAVLVSIGR